MKGIVLAGGTGSCLPLLTAVTNKHLLPVSNYPMVFHPIAGLKQAGIKDTLVVTGRDHRGTSWNCWAAGMTSVWTSPTRCRTSQVVIAQLTAELRRAYSVVLLVGGGPGEGATLAQPESLSSGHMRGSSAPGRMSL